MNSKSLLAVALAMTTAFAFAQSEEQVLNSDPIDVDGYLKEKNVTDHELEQIRSEIRKQKNEVQLNKQKTKGFKELSKTTEKLSDTTEEYIDEKKNTQKEIAEYNKKIKCLMEENPGPDCAKYVRNARKEELAPVVQEVKVAAAAPVVSTAEVAPLSDPQKAFEQIKLSLDGGVTNYSGERETLRADNLGLRVESNITDRFSMNVGFGYTSFQTEDFANNMFGNQGWSQQYYGNYGEQGRDIEYKNFGFDVGGKFFIARTERFRPYLGLNVGYNMASLNYMQNDEFNPTGFNYQFGNEEFKTSFANVGLALGTEILFTRSVGLTLQGSYSRGLGSSLSSESSTNVNNNPDQKRLNELADEVINANALSITAGLMVIF